MTHKESVDFLRSLPKPAIQIDFSCENFNTTTNRSYVRMFYGSAELRTASDGLVCVFGSLGCGKMCENAHDALIAYLGGRRLISHRVND